MSSGYPPPDGSQRSSESYNQGYPDGIPAAQPVNSPSWGAQPNAPGAAGPATFGATLNAVVAALGRDVLIVVAGALVTILAFFVLPYVTASVQATNSIVAPLLDGLCGPSHCNYSFTAPQLLSRDISLLLVPLLAGVAAVVVVLAALRALPIAALTLRTGAIVAAAAGVLSLLLLANQFAIISSVVGPEVDVANTLTGLAGVHIAVGFGPGYWLMFLGIVAILVGGAMELARPTPR